MSREVSLQNVVAVVISTLCLAIGGIFFVTPSDAPVKVAGTPLIAAGIYPSISGSRNPAVIQSNINTTICSPNWTKTIRPPSSYTTALKDKQLKEYGYRDQDKSHYEEDHFISLVLGGNPTDPNNLWPQPYTASIADGGARTKDKVENYLHRQVCSGVITLAQAQNKIVVDWYAVYINEMQGKYGSVDTYIDEDDE